MRESVDKQARLAELRAASSRAGSRTEPAGQRRSSWQATGYYTAYYATTGFILGGIAAMSSLLFNIVGAHAVRKAAVGADSRVPDVSDGRAGLDYNAVDNGMILAIGCCLYLGTGMVYGMLFQIVLTRFTADSSLAARFVVVSLLAIAVWLVNFYGILSWLQPLLFGGRWIVDQIPWWVAALTHLVFGWTMVVVYPLGRYHALSRANGECMIDVQTCRSDVAAPRAIWSTSALVVWYFLAALALSDDLDAGRAVDGACSWCIGIRCTASNCFRPAAGGWCTPTRSPTAFWPTPFWARCTGPCRG